MKDNDIWFWYKKNKLDVRRMSWEGFIIFTVLLILLVAVGFYVLDGEDSLTKSLLGLVWIIGIVIFAYVLVDKKGKHVKDKK